MCGPVLSAKDVRRIGEDSRFAAVRVGRLAALASALFLIAASFVTDSLSAGFRAGSAKLRITPTEPGWIGGYSHRDRPAEGVAAELWTRVLAFEDSSGSRVVLANADIHIFSRRMHKELAAAARSRYGLEEHQLMLVATHNHSGPALPEGFDPYINWGLDEVEMGRLRAAADLIRDQILAGIGQSLADLQPARLSAARGRAEFGVNRRVRLGEGNYDFGANSEGVSDPDVPVLVVESPAGVPISVVFTYACHCTSIRRGQEGFYKYHPDFAGVAAQEIEQRMDGATAIFVTGCAGDIDPQPQGGVQQAEANGRTLAASVFAALEQSNRRPLAGPLRATYREIDLELGRIPSREKFVELSRSSNAYHQRHARRILEEMDAGTLATSVPYPIQIWHFDPSLAMVALAGEVCVDYALRIKRELGPDRVWPVAYANEVPGYIPSERILEEGGYEAGWDHREGRLIPSSAGSTIFYGWAAPFAPGLEDRILEAVKTLFGE